MGEWWVFLVIIAAWFVVNRYILPRFGVNRPLMGDPYPYHNEI